VVRVVRDDGSRQFEFFVPMERGVRRHTFDGKTQWTVRESFANQLPVDAVAATVDGQGYSVVVRSGRSVYYIACDAGDAGVGTWTEPTEITFGDGADGTATATA
jgi:hypothetical protein